MSVLISGSIANDTIMTYSGTFADQINSDSLVNLNINCNIDSMVRYPGGTAHNIAYAMDQVGQVGKIVATVGSDFKVPEQCSGIDYSYVHHAPDILTASAMIITDRESNQICTFYPGASGTGLEEDISKLGDISWSIVSPNNPNVVKSHVRQLADRMISFFFDPGQILPTFDCESLREMIDLSPYLIVNHHEKELLCKLSEREFDDVVNQFEKVVVTHGGEGVQLREGSAMTHYPAESVQQVIDPTGAGDALRGGLLAGLSSGMSREDSITQGQHLAAKCVQTKGTMQRTI